MTQLIELPAGAAAIDCATKLNEQSAAALKAAGVAGVLRYLTTLTDGEVRDILEAELALGVIANDRGNWTPSGYYGDFDGWQTVARLKALKLPEGLTAWYPLEMWHGASDGAILAVDAYARAVQAANFEAGLYVGYAAAPLTSEQLWRLGVTRYWRSCSEVPEVAECGYCMQQQYPPNQHVAGVQVDRDLVQADALGRLPHWAVRDGYQLT